MRVASIMIVVALAVSITLAAISSRTEPKLVEPQPQRWRAYEVGAMDVYEWRDEWGRVCTALRMDMQAPIAIDCDYPQRNTP